MYYKNLYNRASEILGELTPLYSDCGKLCGGACCKGDENLGMRLFPHEESVLNKTALENGTTLAVCNGSCERQLRPLSCKIFPFFPIIHDDGHISADIDVRAINLCPMVKNCDVIKFNKDFIIAVRKVGRLLATNSEIADFLLQTKAEIETYKKLHGFYKTYSKRR